MVLTSLRSDLRSFGFRLVGRALLWRLLNRVVPCRAIVAMVLDRVEEKSLMLPEGFTSRVATTADLLPHVGTPGFSFTRESLERAERRGDETYAVFHGDRLASTGAYSTRPTIVDGYPTYFNTGLVYMHHGYTHPDYRGLRLHAIGMARALREYQGRGMEMIISDVDARNLSSLKSVYRLGYRDIGMIYVFSPFGRHVCFTTGRCRAHGFRFGAPVDESKGLADRPVHQLMRADR